MQYVHWLFGIVRGDFGYSTGTGDPWSTFSTVSRAHATGTHDHCLCCAVVRTTGVISAVRQDTWGDYIVRVVSISGLCIPAFFAGVLLLFVLVRFFQWMPPLEFTAFIDNPMENLKQLIWPTLAQAFYISAPITRLTRSLMLEVIREDYIRTAHAKGLPERAVVYQHALRNVLIPLVTFVSWWGGGC